MTPEQEKAFKERLAAEEAAASGESEEFRKFRERLAAEDAVTREKMANALYGIGGGAASALALGRPINAFVEGMQKPPGVSVHPVAISPTPTTPAVENWTKTQHAGDFFGGRDYTGAHERAMNVKSAVAQTPGFSAAQGTGLLAPREALEQFEKEKVLKEAAERLSNMSWSERFATQHPSVSKGGAGVANLLKKGTAPFVGRSIAGSMGGYQAIDAYNRAVQGDVPGAVLSGLGSTGAFSTLVPIPKVRGVGALTSGIAEIANQARDANVLPTEIQTPEALSVLNYLFKKEPEKKAAGGLAGYSKGKKVVDVAKKFVGSLPPAENAARTQIIGTLPTYEKAGQILQAQGAGGRGLDFGAGLGEGAKRLPGRWDTYEPYAKGWNPTYSEMSQIPEEAYGQLTNLNVLNVVPREVRDELVQGIGRSMEPGGSGIITTRGKDVMSAKGRPGPEPMSIITSRDTYQKGFTPAELEEYLKYMLGQGYDINRLNLGPAGAMIRKKAEGGPVNMALGGEPFTALLKQIAKRRGVSKSDLPKITDIKSFNAGPAVIKPRPIAQGSELYRETNPQSLEDILRLEKQFDTSRFFVADNPDIALGQGSNVGANLVFRPDTLSGMQHLKPGTGNLAGREYITDLIAPKAIDYFSLNNASDLKNLSPFVRRQIQSNFERLEDPNFLSFARKKAEGGLAGYAAGGHATPAWQRKEGQNPEGGLNAAGRASYKRETGGELKRPQPEGGPRRDSFCARMKGMKKKLTSAKTANDPDSRINKSLRAWNC